MKRLAAFLLPVLASAACLPVASDRITASDVAEAVPALSVLPVDQVLSYAPLPGNSRVFTAAELRQRVPDAKNLPESVCFEWPLRNVSAEELRTAMTAVLPEGAEVVVSGEGVVVPNGPLQFSLSGLSGDLWRGRVQYAPGRHHDFRVRTTVMVPRVVATETIQAAERIEAGKLRLEMGSPSAGQATALSDVTGRIARRQIAAGAPIPSNALDRARTVAKGDPVQVHVVSGGARVRFDGLAQASAGTGEIVPVRNPDSGRVIHARVTDMGVALLELASSAKEK